MAVEICKRYEIDEDVKPHLRGNQTADDFVQELAAHGLLRHALRFQAHRLAKRESVWWACRCVRLGCGDRLSPEDRVAVEAAEQWVRQPGDEPARAAERAAESLGYQTAGGWAAAAAFWSGESLAPPGLQAVTPAEHLTGTAVSAALILAGISEDPRKAPQRYREFLNLAAKLVRGEELWPSE